MEKERLESHQAMLVTKRNWLIETVVNHSYVVKEDYVEVCIS